MKKICVFCGSSYGDKPEYKNAAEKLGQVFLNKKLELIYGGARVGLMGTIASTIHKQGGNVIGVIPEMLLKREVAFTELSDLRIVGSMHERKTLMYKIADGFIAMPGGLGTIEEFFEMLTWAQLGFHSKPCGLLNINGYFDFLVEFLNHAANERFIDFEYLDMILIDNNAEGLVYKMSSYKPPKIDKAKRALEKLNNSGKNQ